MTPVRFPEANVVLAMDQEQYEPIAVYLAPGDEGIMTACFRLSEAEIAEMVMTRTLWVSVMTFRRGFPPIALSSQKPEM